LVFPGFYFVAGTEVNFNRVQVHAPPELFTLGLVTCRWATAAIYHDFERAVVWLVG